MKLKTSELQALFADARKRIKQGSVWNHKKGGQYMVLGFGYDTEKEQLNVHYFRIAGPGFNEGKERGIIFDRPYCQWTEDRFTQVNVFRPVSSAEQDGDA